MQLIQSDRSESLSISIIRAVLTKMGAHASRQTLDRLNYWLERVMSQLEAGRWFRAHGFPIKPAYSCRRRLYTAVARKIAHEQVLYLEFGVFQGASMRIWSELLNNPCCSLHGFDSFEGLPENWNTLHPQGTFDTKGTLPTFDDSRVQLHVGWFTETLPTFMLPQHIHLPSLFWRRCRTISASAPSFSSTNSMTASMSSRRLTSFLRRRIWCSAFLAAPPHSRNALSSASARSAPLAHPHQAAVYVGHP